MSVGRLDGRTDAWFARCTAMRSQTTGLTERYKGFSPQKVVMVYNMQEKRVQKITYKNNNNNLYGRNTEQNEAPAKWK